MTLSLEEAVGYIYGSVLADNEKTTEGIVNALKAYARHIVEKAAPKDGFNAGTADYHSRLLEEISK